MNKTSCKYCKSSSIRVREKKFREVRNFFSPRICLKMSLENNCLDNLHLHRENKSSRTNLSQINREMKIGLQ